MGAARTSFSRRRRPARSRSTRSAAICRASPNTGTPLASFLLGQVQNFSIDLQQEQIQERARFQEYFVQDDWKVSDRLTVNPGLRYTLNFPVDRDQRSDGGLQPADAAARVPGRPTRCARCKKNNFGPRLGVVYRLTDKTVVSSGYGLVWIEMAGITTPFTTPTFPFLQTVSQRALDTISPGVRAAERPERRADSRRRRRPDSGRASSPSTARSGPATCSSGTCRSSAS